MGDWKSDGELKANPFMPAGKYSSDDECKWFEGGFAVVCESEGKNPAGAPTKSIGIIGYSGEEKAYTYYGVDNSGMVPTTVAKGTVQGDAWTFTDESKFGGVDQQSQGCAARQPATRKLVQLRRHRQRSQPRSHSSTQRPGTVASVWSNSEAVRVHVGPAEA